jgi:phosphoribosyl 1,2-cyclic phosphodiesterase
VRAWTLGSGSRGNAILLESEGTRVLIDAGYPPRTLARRLAFLAVTPSSIDAVIVTHEHVDHARGVAAAQAKWRWSAYGSAGTLGRIDGLDTSLATAVSPGAAFAIGSLAFTLVRVPHDAAAATAVLATSPRSGFRTGIAHDLGEVPAALLAAFDSLDLLLLESNHDEQMLRNGPYPPFLQERVAGRFGHLGNRQAAACLRALASPSLREVALLHLSEKNNTPAAALASARAALSGGASKRSVTAAMQDEVAGPFGAATGAGHGHQFALAL